ncbi:class I tRNA ligase family protein, partial [Patescibacteria group bacterium]
DDKKFGRYWPADLHLVGKDIIKFHCALWPAMLMSADIPLPKQVFAHGFFTINGDKMSKSLGNAIDPKLIAEEYGIDVVRYFLLREITFGEDGDFSVDRLRQRYSGELANELGNLLHRTLSMTDKYFDGKVPTMTAETDPNDRGWEAYEEGLEKLDFAKALDAIWDIIRASNKFIEDRKPWELAKTDKDALGKVIYLLLERLRHVAWMLAPIAPEIARKMFVQLGRPDELSEGSYDEAKVWGGMRENDTIAKGEPLFPHLEE